MQIELGKNVVVSDPCYGMNVWCKGELNNVLPGIYDCKVQYSDEGDWGIRVKDISAVHNEIKDISLCYKLEPFTVGVDSGQAGIFDYDYYREHHTENDVNDEWYDKVCKITLGKQQAGSVDNLGVVSATGYGDGAYACYTAKNEKGCVVAIRIIFIENGD